jgi:hypothetical protein
MAGTAVLKRLTSPAGSAELQGLIELNRIVTDLETIRGVAAEGNALLEELHDDHASFRTSNTSLKTLADELKADYAALLADVAAIRTAYNATLAKLDLDATVTDSNYAATNPAPAATATAIAAADATAPPAALTATKPTSASINAAGDLTAAQVKDIGGTVIAT